MPGLPTHRPYRLARLLPFALCMCASGVGWAQQAPRFINPPGLAPSHGYSHVVEAPAGRTLYLSGRTALDARGNLAGTDMAAQAEQVFANLKLALAGAGARFTDVVKLTFYVADMRQLAAIRAARDRYIDTAHPPASTLVEVRRLVRDDLLLEVDAVAVVTTGRANR